MASNPFRAELSDGSRIERNYKLEPVDGKAPRRVGYGNWIWLVYDPERQPARKKVNLRTKDKAAAMRLATDLARKRALGLFDPWDAPAPDAGVTVEEAAARYLRERARTSAPNTVEADRGHLDRLARALPAGALVRHVTAAHVAAFVSAPKRARKDGTGGGDASAETQKRRRASVQHFFGWAVAQGMARANPATGAAVPKAPAARRDHVTTAEAVALLDALAGAEASVTGRDDVFSGADRTWIRDWIVFGLGTGLRPGEQRALRWGAVRLAERSVDVGKGARVKTAGSARTVPVRGEALGVLQRRAAARPNGADGLVFTGAGGGPVAVDYLSRCLQRLAAAAELDRNVTAYTLRHAYGTEMAAQGVPLLALARIMGTSVRMIEAHYGHHDPDRAAAHVERVFGAATTPARPGKVRAQSGQDPA